MQLTFSGSLDGLLRDFKDLTVDSFQVSTALVLARGASQTVALVLLLQTVHLNLLIHCAGQDVENESFLYDVGAGL